MGFMYDGESIFVPQDGDIVIGSLDDFGEVLELLVQHAQEHMGPEWTAEMVIKELQAYV